MSEKSTRRGFFGAIAAIFAAPVAASRAVMGGKRKYPLFDEFAENMKAQQSFDITFMPYGPEAPTDCMLFGCGEDGVWHEIRGVTDIEGGIPWKS